MSAEESPRGDGGPRKSSAATLDNADDISGDVHKRTTVYEARPIKRHRPTKVEMDHRRDRVVEIARDNQPCSVRHLYYRAVVDGLVDKTESGYVKIQRAALELRRNGRIPYHWVTDNSRTMFTVDTWGSITGFLDDMAGVYRRDLWARTPYRVEVWCESDSIAGTITKRTQRWRVPVFPMKGQSSETFAHNAVQQWLDDPGRQPVVLYIGDHDPAGLEIEQALYDKLDGFARKGGMEPPWFERIGVTWQQAEELDLPGTTPKKDYGFPLAVEAEALPPGMLRDLLDEHITEYVNHGHLRTLEQVEAEERRGLLQLAEYFPAGGAT